VYTALEIIWVSSLERFLKSTEFVAPKLVQLFQPVGLDGKTQRFGVKL